MRYPTHRRLVEAGDQIALNINNRRLDLNVEESELAQRRATWSPRSPNYDHDVFAKYASLVIGAERGAVTS